MARTTSEQQDGSPKVCVGHPSRKAEDQCEQCGLPLCAGCSYHSPQSWRSTYCERHVPRMPDEVRDKALGLLARGRADFARLNAEAPPSCEEVLAGSLMAWGIGFALGGVVGGRLALDLHASSEPSASSGGRRFVETAQSVASTLKEALLLDPTCEEAVLLLCELAALCDAAGQSEVVSLAERRAALERCSGSNPMAIGARFFARCQSDPAGALRGYFHRLLQSASPRWDPTTLLVVEAAVEQGQRGIVLSCLGALLHKLPRSSAERRQCRNKVFSLQSSPEASRESPL